MDVYLVGIIVEEGPVAGLDVEMRDRLPNLKGLARAREFVSYRERSCNNETSYTYGEYGATLDPWVLGPVDKSYFGPVVIEQDLRVSREGT